MSHRHQPRPGKWECARAERDDVGRLLSDVEQRNIQIIRAEERICRD